MKKTLLIILLGLVMNQSVYGWDEVKIKNRNIHSEVYEEEGTLYANPMLLEKGGSWHIVKNGDKVFAELQIGTDKRIEFVELPSRIKEKKNYIDFSFFSHQAGLDYVYNKKKKELVITKQKKKPEPDMKENAQKIIYMWDPESSYRSGNSYFTKNYGKRILSPTWGSYKTLDETPIPIPLTYLKEAKKEHIKIEPLLHNDFDIAATKKLMNDKKEILHMSGRMAAIAVVYDFNGWNLDFENMDMADKEKYTDFIKEIANSLHQQKKNLSADITVYDVNSPNWSLCYDREALAEFVDYEIVMGYDQTPGGSAYPGSTSSYDWLDKHISKLLAMIPKEKLILGLPLYTRVWRGDSGNAKSSVLTLRYTKEFINRHHLKAHWDNTKKQYISNWTEKGVPHKVWFEEYRSLAEKLNLIDKYELPGTAFWRYGFGEEDLYSELEKGDTTKDVFAPQRQNYGDELILRFKNKMKRAIESN